MSGKPVIIDVAFEAEAKRATRRCWTCKRIFDTATQMHAHQQDAHPNGGRPRIEWSAAAGKWLGGF